MRIPIVDQVISLVRNSGGAGAKRGNTRDERLRIGLDQSPVGIAFVTPDGHWLFANTRFRDLLGYTREELPRISLHGITHPDDAKRELPLIKRLLAADVDHYRVEKRVMDKRGRYRTVDAITAVCRASTGAVDFFVYVIDDPQPSVIDQLTDIAVIRTDERGVILDWNAGAERLLGYTRDEIVGKNRRVLYRDPEMWHGRSTSVLKEASVAGRLEIEDWRVGKDGRQIWARCAISSLRPDGVVRGYVETISPPADVPKGIDMRPAIENLRAELGKSRRTEESLRSALEDLRRMAEETMEELRIMTGALRKEIDRRKALEEELRQARSAPVAAAAAPVEEEIVVEAPPKRKWKALGDGGVAEVLLRHASAEHSGTLFLARDGAEKEIFFENGRLFSCASNDPGKFLTQRLVERRVITEEQRQKAIEIKQASQLALGRILLILDAINEAQLVDAMRDKLEEEIREVLQWSDGRHAFVEGEVPALQLVPLRIDVADLVARLTAPPMLFVASSKSRKVHTQACRSAQRISGDARVPFANVEDAVAQGFERCRVCLR